MTAVPERPRRILAVTDMSERQIALRSALALAERPDASVEAIACVDLPQDLSILSRLSGARPESLVEGTVERVRSTVLERLAAIAPDRPIPLFVTAGKTYLEIIRHVVTASCDFVVKTAEPLAGLERFLFSSTDQHLLRKCPCPVWLQTPGAPTEPNRVLAAVDLDVVDADEPETLAELNRRVLAAACMLAGPANAEVIVFHAWDAIGEGMIWAFSGSGDPRMSADRYVNEIIGARHEAMDRLLSEVRTETGSHPRLVPRLVRGAPERVTHDLSREVAADVVVMGTVARTGLSGVFIGNTAENIINSLECPVLAVKPGNFSSPLLHR